MSPTGTQVTEQWPLDEAIAAMDRWDVGPMRAWLESRLCTPASGISVANFAKLESSAWWNSNTGESAGSIAVRILDAAATTPESIAPLLLYYRYVGMAAWEESWTVDAVLDLIATVSQWVAALPAGVAAGNQPDVSAAGRLLDFLGDEMGVFAIGIAGSLGDWAGAAGRVGQTAQELLNEIATAFPSVTRLYVRTCLVKEAAYYSMVHDAAAAAFGIRAGEMVPVAALDAAIARLVNPPAGLDRADGSELRAHRASLKALRNKLCDDWLLVDKGRISMLFPFGLSEIPDREVVDRARRRGIHWRLADLPVVSVSDNLPVSDAWDSSDPLDRAFRGAALRLPEIDLTQPDGGLKQRIHPSVWLSELGNHLLRLDFTVEGVGPLELYECVRIASPEYLGAARLGYTIEPIFEGLGEEKWDSLNGFASRCVASLVENLTDAQYRPTSHYAPQEFLVLTVLDEARAWCPATGQTRELDGTDEVLGLFGSQILTQAIWSNLASVAQWAQVPTVAQSVAMPSLGAVSATMTENSALIAGFGSPSYTLDLLSDCFVFAASIDALFGTWYGELARMNKLSEGTLLGIVSRMGVDGHQLTSDEVRKAEARLEDAQIQLHDFVVRCRSILLFIESPTLVQFPPLRALLNALLESCSFGARRASFLESAEAMTQGRMESVLGRLRARIHAEEVQRRNAFERRSRLALDALLAGVAVAGLSGLASLVQAGYQLGEVPTGLLVVTVVLASVAIGIGVWRISRGGRHE